MSDINKKSSWFTLILNHMIGVIDLTALPIWVGILIAAYSFQPVEAGGLTTIFLSGALLASLVLSPIFHKLNGRLFAAAGYAIAALCFVANTQVTGFLSFAVLYAVAGFGVGMAISCTHGTMGRTSNPHRVFGLASFGVSLMSLVYLGIMPKLIGMYGPSTLFYGFVFFFGVIAFINLFLFPVVRTEKTVADEGIADIVKFNKRVLFAIFGMIGIAFNVAMVLAFVVREAIERGFGEDKAVQGLVIMSVIALPATLFAAFAQKRLSPAVVAPIGAVIHGAVGLSIMAATTYPVFFGSLIFFAPILLFVHPFVFGMLAQADPSGRAVAATPIMMMTGSAFGPVVGGIFVQTLGYTALGVAAFAISVVSMVLFFLSRSIVQEREALA